MARLQPRAGLAGGKTREEVGISLTWNVGLADVVQPNWNLLKRIYIGWVFPPPCATDSGGDSGRHRREDPFAFQHPRGDGKVPGAV